MQVNRCKATDVKTTDKKPRVKKRDSAKAQRQIEELAVAAAVDRLSLGIERYDDVE